MDHLPNNDIPHSLHWQAFEYHTEHKTTDWYWTVGIISVSVVVLLIFFGNILLAIVAVLGAFAAVLHAHHGPNIIRCELNQRGVAIDDRLYSYATLESFWIDHQTRIPKILIKSQKVFMTLIVIPLPAEDNDELIRQFLLQYLPEEEHHEPFFQKLLEHIGF